MARPGGPAYGSRALEIGTDGLDTWELQIKLIGWGSGSDNDGIGNVMDPVRVTGKFDSTTRDAVKRFQKAHGLAITGVVDGTDFRAIDDEVGNHPVPFASLKCPCAAGKNNGPILCRCNNHPSAGACGGFGNGRFAGKFLLDNSASFSAEKLAVYDMEEHPGVDKTAIWAVRALMHRAGLGRIKVASGYRCWHDAYHETDEIRWRHRKTTLNLGNGLDFLHPKTCIEKGNSPCPECERVRKVAVAKCGYQLRWLEPDRVTIGEGGMNAAPPTTPFAVHVDTILLKNREKADFVKTDADAAAPLYTGKVGVSLPMDLGEGKDPKIASTAVFYDNTEKAKGGFFPLGHGRIWHPGIHLYPKKGGAVHAMMDGEVVACRAGEAEDAKPLGSRNFVLVKHTWKSKTLYSLYMHLDGEKPSAKAKVRWRKVLYFLTKDHVEVIEAGSIYRHIPAGKGTLSAVADIGPGDMVETTGGEVDPTTLDPKAPKNSKVIKVDDPKNTRYVYTKLDGKDVAKIVAKDAGLATSVGKADVIGLEKGIPVHAADLVGNAGKAATDPGVKALGSFVHLEMFSDSSLLTDAGYVAIDASAAAKVADRKEIVKALVDSKLLTAPQDSVLLEEEMKALADDPNRGRFRSVVLKMESSWSINWKDAFSGSKTLGFMKDADRDALGTAFMDYEWWPLAKAGAKGSMPGSPVVYHYHPIVMLLQVAYSP